jgi:hypothetical protein
MSLNLEETSVRLLAGLLANPSMVKWESSMDWEGNVDPGKRVILARAAVDMALSLNDIIVDFQNVKAMEAMQKFNAMNGAGTP